MRSGPGVDWGDPSKASAKKGREIEEIVADALERLVVELDEFVDPDGCWFQRHKMGAILSLKLLTV